MEIQVALEYRFIKELDGPHGLFSNFPTSEPEGQQADANFAYIAAHDPARMLRIYALLREMVDDLPDGSPAKIFWKAKLEGDL